MSSLREIEAAVRKLSPREIGAFSTWFNRFRARVATSRTGAELTTRLKETTRAERRALAVRAAEESAEYYRRRPGEILADIVDEED